VTSYLTDYIICLVCDITYAFSRSKLQVMEKLLIFFLQVAIFSD